MYGSMCLFPAVVVNIIQVDVNFRSFQMQEVQSIVVEVDIFLIMYFIIIIIFKFI